MAHSHGEHGRQEAFLQGLHTKGTLGRRTVVHISPAATSCQRRQEKEPSDATLPTYEERRLVLLDGTQVIVENQWEYMVTGPKGASIVLNCLPLYCVPSADTVRKSFSASDDEDASVSEVAHVEMSSSAEGIGSAVTSTASAVQQRSSGNGTERYKWVDFDESVRLHQDGASCLTSSPILSLPEGTDGGHSEPQMFNTFEDNFSPLPNHDQPKDVFLTVDPFATELPNPLEAHLTYSGIYNSVEVKKWDLSDSDDDSATDESILQVNYVDNVSSMTLRSAAVTFTRSHAMHVTPPQSSLNSERLYATPLPPPPPTIFPRYSERAGWLSKLSHRKGVFGDKWQKRYFILDGCTLKYYKKMGDSLPKGVIQFLPGSWCKQVMPGTKRMADAIANQSKTSFISVNRCLAVHRPCNHPASISRLLSSEGVTEAFNSQSVAFVDPQDASRTFYMIASTDQERDEWVEAIQGNISAYVHSPTALHLACSELGVMLRAVGCNISDSNLPSILLLLYQQTAAIVQRQHSFCKAHQ